MVCHVVDDELDFFFTSVARLWKLSLPSSVSFHKHLGE